MDDKYAELARRFDELTAARAERHRLTASRGRLAPQLREAEGETARLRAAWEKECGDVRRLEGASATRAWAALRGGLDDRLARERAEEEASAFALRRAEQQLERARSEDEALAAQVRALGDLDHGYEETLAEVHRLAQEPGAGALRERSAEAGRQLEDLRWRRELEEAIGAGGEAQRALGEALAELRSAGGWSAYDTFAGGGMLSSLLKHDRLDRATSLLDGAAGALQAFSRELADVELPGIDAPLVDELSRGLDIWFDNFVTDLMVSQRISAARRQVEQALAQVEQTVATLRERRAALGD